MNKPMKNLVTILCVVAVMLASQQPAEAGTIKRAFLRCVKWGVAAPAVVLGCAVMVPGAIAYGAGVAGFGICSFDIQSDFQKEAREAKKAAEATKAAEAKAGK